MTIGIRLLLLGIAIAVNAAALGAAHMAMCQVTLREQLAQFEPERIVVTAPRHGHSVVATHLCPSPGVL